MQAHQQICGDNGKKNTEHIRWSELSQSGGARSKSSVSVSTWMGNADSLITHTLVCLQQISGSPEFNDSTTGEGIRKASSNMS